MASSDSAPDDLTRVAALVSRGDYEEALGVLRRLSAASEDLGLRRQLADLLLLTDRRREAAEVLVTLSDDYALLGRTSRAIAALKKAQEADPDRADLSARLAQLVKDGTTGVSAAARPSVPREGAAAASPAPAPRPQERPAEPARTSLYPSLESLVMEAASARLPPPPPEPPPDEDTRRKVLDEAAAEAYERKLGGSPLFAGFHAEELTALIGLLRLRAYEAGEILVTEGEPGGSLFVLAAGSAKAFVRDRQGRNHRVRVLPEGAFFGEVSVLTGCDRTATVVAASVCEVLELSRSSLEVITAQHPRVNTVLQSVAAARKGSAAEAFVRRSDLSTGG
jgi:tetratricopeptide (TPR) repeat protein